MASSSNLVFEERLQFLILKVLHLKQTKMLFEIDLSSEYYIHVCFKITNLQSLKLFTLKNKQKMF